MDIKTRYFNSCINKINYHYGEEDASLIIDWLTDYINLRALQFSRDYDPAYLNSETEKFMTDLAYMPWHIYDSWKEILDDVSNDSELHGEKPDKDYVYSHYDVVEGNKKILLGS
jgi:hypothetical protein